MERRDQENGVRELFRAGAASYDARQYEVPFRTFIADRQVLISRLVRDWALPPGTRVLDVACGPGRFLDDAASLGLAVVGIDGSPSMLQVARTHLGERAALVRGDAMVLPFASGSFDLVNCSGLIEYLPEPGPMLRELRRVVRPGGRVLVSSTNRLSPALLLQPVVETIRTAGVTRWLVRTLRLPFDDMALRARQFRLTFHTPRRLAELMADAGFSATELRYYHLQLLPHPLDRLFPRLATRLLSATDRLLSRGWTRQLAEGLLACGSSPETSGER